MKKILFLVLIIVLLGGYVAYDYFEKNKNPQDDISYIDDSIKENDKVEEVEPEEEEFNNSGRAKAVESETDLWPFYENKELGISLNYPGDDIFEISIDKVEGLEGTMGYNEETALKNLASLENGEYGTEVDFALEPSKKVRNLEKTNAQDFLVISRFEVCSVLFERKLYFFHKGNQIVITLKGDKDLFIDSMPEYFKLDKENCFDETVWDFSKWDDFYDVLDQGVAPDEVQVWYDDFDKMVETISFS